MTFTGVDVQPRTLSGRLLGSFWWFFSLTVTAMYMANLAAFLTVNRMAMPVDSLQSLANQNKFKFGTVKNSPVHQGMLKVITFCSQESERPEKQN